MTLHKIKKTFVEEKKIMTNMEANTLIARIGVSVIGICLDISLLTYNLIGLGLTVCVVFASMFAFNFVFDMINEDEESLKGIRKFSNFFFVYYIVLVLEFFILKYLRFI